MKPITLKEYDRLANKLINITAQKRYYVDVMDSHHKSGKVGQKGEGVITEEFFGASFILTKINREITRISNILKDVDVEALRQDAKNDENKLAIH